MSVCKDLAGQKFGRLTVLFRNGSNKHKKVIWVCLCECGKITNVITTNLKNGDTKSCGCMQKEIASKMLTKHGFANNILYPIWQTMKQRCSNSKANGYKYYGGRGISVCKEWENNPGAFIKWAQNNGYKNGLQIDRIDNDKNYCPENCRFVTHRENSLNRRPYGKISVKHVSIKRGKYIVEKRINGKTRNFGSFQTLKEAEIKINSLKRNNWVESNE